MRIDVFCRVVDNFGDAGVTWRLARQLAQEHGARVTLRIDMPQALDRIAPPSARDGVDIERLGERTPELLPDLIVEGFGCGLPARYLDAMAASAKPPLWINLEYLSAEPWIDTVHGLPSPQPRLPLVRHFYFPGFTPATGGLLRERDLLAERERARPAGRRASRVADSLVATAARGGVDTASVRVVSLFCYANAALPALLDAWVEGDSPLLCIVPEGVATASFDAWLEGAVPHAGQTFTRGALTLATVPFVSQDEYDRLLWACDFNFVRGEDSFLRAQWGARPFAWHAYPQAGDSHRVKVEAFLDRYLAGADDTVAAAARSFHRAWNDSDPRAVVPAWCSVVAAADALAAHNRRWCDRLAALPDLATSLLEFSALRL